MKTKLNKIAIFWAIMTLLSMGPTAVLADIDNPSITIHKYTPLNLTGDPGSGEPVSSDELEDYRGIKGVTYHLYRVANWQDGAIGSGYQPVDEMDVEIDSSSDPADVYASAVTNLSEEKIVMTTGDDGSVTKDGLALGLYVAKEVDFGGATYVDNGVPVSITRLGDPFFITLPMTRPSLDSYNYDVEVYPKNATATIDKTVSSNMVVGVGETVSYTIAVDVPQDIAEVTQFIVTDTLPSELGYVSYTVADNDQFINPLSNTDFAVVEPQVDSGGELMITFKSMTQELHQNIQDLAGRKIYIRVMAMVNDTTVSVSKISNAAKVSFDPGLADIDIIRDIYSAEVQITKEDASDSQKKLDHVTLQLYKKVESGGEVSQWLPVPHPVEDGDYIVVTADGGKAGFSGLGVGLYRIVEIEAAQGYQLLQKPVEFEVFNRVNQNSEESEEVDQVIKLTITNVEAFKLPITGGLGIYLFPIVGLILIICGAALYGLKRRRKIS